MNISDDCCICLESMDKTFVKNFNKINKIIKIIKPKPMPKIVKLRCNHMFHFKCIARMITNKNECPLCRYKIIDENIDICYGEHDIKTFFNNNFNNKNGYCTICTKKSLLGYIRSYIIE